MATAEAPRASTANSEPPQDDPVEPVTSPAAAGSGAPAPSGAHGTTARNLLNGVTLPLSLYLVPTGILYLAFVLWPLMQVAWLSLHQWDGFGRQTWVGFANFPALWNDTVFRTSLTHTLLWEICAMLLCTTLGLALAILLVRSRAAAIFLSVLFLPVLLPATVVAAVAVLVYSPANGLDALLRNLRLGTMARAWLGDPHLALGALFVAWMWSAVGVSTLVFWSGLQAIAREYYELARLEGAGTLRCFRHVTLPGLRRTGIVVVLLNAALASQVFDLVFVTTGGGPGYATMLLPLDAYGRAFGDRAQVGQGAAAATVQIALSLVLGALAFALLRRTDSFDSGEREALVPSRSNRLSLRTRFARGITTPTGRRGANRSAKSSSVAPTAALVLILFPLAWLPFVALQPGRTFALCAGSSCRDGGGMTWNPGTWNWDSFSTVWNAGMSGAIETSLLLALGVVTATLMCAAPAAFALSRLHQGPLKILALVLLLAGLLQPTPLLIIPLFSELHTLHLLDSVWGIVLPEIARTLPLAVLILWGFLAGTPHDVLEASEVDGASTWQQMVRVALPLARPAVVAVAIWSFVLSWNEYLLPTVVSQDGSIQTVPTLLGSFIGTYDTQFNLLAAGALLAMLPTLGMYLLLRHSAAAGLAGAGRGRAH
jgi:raffinose/stachyose/melibiose transport system permease protein